MTGLNSKCAVWLVVLAAGLFLQGCLGNFTNSRTQDDSKPHWSETAMAKAPEAEETQVAYADDTVPEGSSPSPANALGLVTDQVNSPLERMEDYTRPETVKGNQKKAVKKKTGEEKDLDGRGYRGVRQDVNVSVNTSPILTEPVKEAPPAPLSPAENRYNSLGELTRAKKLRQFGYDLITFVKPGQDLSRSMVREKKGAPLFSQDEATRLFADTKPVEDRFSSSEYTELRPMLSEYVMAPGDEILIKITGPFDMAEVFTVDRNGEVFIPRIGGILLGGKPAGQLQKLVAEKARTVFMDAHVQASLGRLRNIQVTVTGQVNTPGLIQVTAGASLLNALAAAGGPAKTGTLRRVELRRRNGEIRHLDLYAVLLDGRFDQDPMVLSGDIIHVGPVGATAALMSPGNDGRIFEILPGETLSGLVARTGVINNFTDTAMVLTERTDGSGGRQIQTLNLNTEGPIFALTDGDAFQFFATHAYSYNSVVVQGPVVRTGTFPFAPGMHVSDLLKLTKGFLVNAALDKALLIRELGEETPFSIMAADKRGSQKNQLIWLDLDRILAGDKAKDLALIRLDRLTLFSREDLRPDPRVSILGGVRKPGQYRLTAGMTLSDLVLLAGGPTQRAYEGESAIVRRRHSQAGKSHFDVKIIPFTFNEVLNRQKAARILLENHDKVVIRQVNNLEVSVDIQGRVQFPGTYVLPSGSRITDLVAIAGGILDEADLRAAVFQRQRVRDLEHKELNSFYATVTERFARVRDEVTLSGRPNESLANQLSLLGQDRLLLNMKQFQATGRVVIDMTANDFPDRDDNMILEDGDTLRIPQKMTTVTVMGRIFNPSAYLWQEGLSVEDYLEKSGGLLEDGDNDRVYVVLANGEVKSAAQKGGRSKLMDFQPSPGDIVFVPQEPLGRSGMAQVMDVLQMLRILVGTGAVAAAIPAMDNAVPTLDLKTDPEQRQTIMNQIQPGMYEETQEAPDYGAPE